MEELGQKLEAVQGMATAQGLAEAAAGQQAAAEEKAEAAEASKAEAEQQVVEMCEYREKFCTNLLSHLHVCADVAAQGWAPPI